MGFGNGDWKLKLMIKKGLGLKAQGIRHKA
jgi:hypothetical protein